MIATGPLVLTQVVTQSRCVTVGYNPALKAADLVISALLVATPMHEEVSPVSDDWWQNAPASFYEMPREERVEQLREELTEGCPIPAIIAELDETNPYQAERRRFALVLWQYQLQRGQYESGADGLYDDAQSILLPLLYFLRWSRTDEEHWAGADEYNEPVSQEFLEEKYLSAKMQLDEWTLHWTRKRSRR